MIKFWGLGGQQVEEGEGLTAFDRSQSFKGGRWIDLNQPTNEEWKRVERALGIARPVPHPPMPAQLTHFPGHIFLSLVALGPDGRADHLQTVPLVCYLGHEFLVTVHHGPLEAVDRVATALREGDARRRVDEILYLVVDEVIDAYFPLLDDIDDRIDRIEERIFREPGREVSGELFALKRRLAFLRRALAPQRDMVNRLLREESPYLSREIRPLFLGAFDHILRLLELVETYRDLVSSALEAYLTAVSNRTNDIMKVLTIITTIMMPLTVITGIYGMNFRFMPELNFRFGYPLTLGLMLLVALIMLAYFRRKRWL